MRTLNSNVCFLIAWVLFKRTEEDMTVKFNLCKLTSKIAFMDTLDENGMKLNHLSSCNFYIIIMVLTFL